MDQLDDALGKLLNDPGAMAQVMNLAQSLGASLPAQSAERVEPTPDLGALTALVKGDNRQSALLQALGAYLSPKRREKLARAMQLSRLSGLIKAAMQQYDSDEGG